MNEQKLGAICAFACTIALAGFVHAAQAKDFSVLYSFAGAPDGAYPEASLLRDAAGNLYGTTETGGANDAGTVFRLAAHGGESVLYSFGGTGDGANPVSSLIADKTGNLYGTTENGGTGGGGTVFRLAPDGTETVLYSFTGGSDGGSPSAGLTRKSGSLYGTTVSGGAGDKGVVFRLAPNGKETVIHSFTGGNDGSEPFAGLLANKAGRLTGTTYTGGAYDHGTVFRISPDGSETVLYAFSGGSDGGSPAGAVVADGRGNLFGTTLLGGTNDSGTVYKLTPDGSETVLYSFTGQTDGADPSCGLVFDASGNLYGTTPVSQADSDGAVFKLSPKGKLTVLHAFSGAGGAGPVAGLIADEKGQLYGTTPISGAYGYGVVFELKE